MFIKVKYLNDAEFLLNTDHIVSIVRFARPDSEGCYVTLSTPSEVLEVKTTIGEFEMLLNVDSVEKRIEALKQENLRRRIQLTTEDAITRAVYGPPLPKTTASQLEVK